MRVSSVSGLSGIVASPNSTCFKDTKAEFHECDLIVKQLPHERLINIIGLAKTGALQKFPPPIYVIAAEVQKVEATTTRLT